MFRVFVDCAERFETLTVWVKTDAIEEAIKSGIERGKTYFNTDKASLSVIVDRAAM